MATFTGPETIELIVYITNEQILNAQYGATAIFLFLILQPQFTNYLINLNLGTFDDDDINNSHCIFICCLEQYQHNIIHVQYY